MLRKLSVGAEAIVYADEVKKAVIKQRQPKKYRLAEIDETLRLHRMRREAKIIAAMRQLRIPVPKLIKVDEKTAAITMQLIRGKKVRDILNRSNYGSIGSEIGKSVGVMHKNNIVHGDLTTSNMMLSNGSRGNSTNGGSEDKIYFIDFGLSLFSQKEEDKAVDLHLFRQALNSSHSEIAEECFAAAITAYKEMNSSGWKAVLKRLEKVEGRGRNKGKGWKG